MLATLTSKLNLVAWVAPTLLLVVDAQAEILSINPHYAGVLNGESLVASGTGQLDTSGLGDNSISLVFSSVPSGLHFAAMCLEMTTIVSWNAVQPIGNALNLFQLSGGNYHVDRVFTWPQFPGSQILNTATVSLNNGVLAYDATIDGIYEGPNDLVGIANHQMTWTQLDATSVQLSGGADLIRENGSTFQVRIDGTYTGLTSPMPTQVQQGAFTSITYNWNNPNWSATWSGFMAVPEPSSFLLLAASTPFLLCRKRATKRGHY